VTAIITDQIDGTPRSIKQLFSGRKYGLKYYQREYAWTENNLKELIDDVATRFLEEHRPDHQRRQVASYRPYFLGPIVTANEQGILFLVDGQQRLTTLTLILMWLLRTSEDQDGDLKPLIYSTQFGEQSFNIHVETREEIMRAILAGEDFDPTSTDDESVRNIWARFQDLETLFPQELREPQVLPFFIDWLLERVVIVEIAATDSDMALEIFETMNDRGARLTSTDMLKSYLLARLAPTDVDSANVRWRQRIADLTDLEKTADADFLKAWLRAKYADNIRERRAGAAPQDWDIIGTGYHKWVRDHAERIGLQSESHFARFINRDFDVMSRRYRQLLLASQAETPGFEHVNYLATTGFTLHHQVILAATTPDDDEATFQAKTRMISGYLDRLVVLRIVNYRNFGYSQMVYAMFLLIKELRDLEPDKLAATLLGKIEETDESFDAVANLRLHQRNGGQVRYLLARMNSWVDRECNTGQPFSVYMDRARKNPFEIEHIWANHAERHPEFANEYQFADTRNNFGGLLLLPKDFNASYGDMPYEDKVEHYLGQNLLTRSLHPGCYSHNPGFRRLLQTRSLPFKAYPATFAAEDMAERQDLYRKLCELIWAPVEFGVAS